MAELRGEPRLVWGVAALLQAVGDALAARWAACTVAGEISGFSRAASGHCYFMLKDGEGAPSLVRCAMFRRAASLLSFAPRDGQRVELRGRIAVYEARGELQLVVEAMQLAGAGSRYEEFLRLKARLEAEGLFDPERKRALPRFPRGVGVVTSPGGAALHDVLTALARRSPHLRVLVYPTPVQGDEAPPAIARALAMANARAEVDALLLCRGGGSLEDLWAFNDERVVRAVAGSALTVVCGVGHETDVTLADFAADLRAPTPTAGAELIAPRTEDCERRLQELQRRLSRLVRHRLETQAQQLDGAMLRLSRPIEQLRLRERRLALLAQRLGQSLPARLLRAEGGLAADAARLRRAGERARAGQAHRLAALGHRLEALDPARVLRRGYAWVANEGGVPIASVARLEVGARLRAVLADGELLATIDEVRPSAAGAPADEA